MKKRDNNFMKKSVCLDKCDLRLQSTKQSHADSPTDQDN